ncbi:MAG: Arm DNA-binding domain-containing protein [Acidobacteriota bacterium]
MTWLHRGYTVEVMGKLNPSFIDRLKPPQDENSVQWGTDVKGFGIRTTSGGAKSFVLSYRIHGRKRRYTIGRFPEWTVTAARTKAVSLKQKISEGHGPFDEKFQWQTEPTVAGLGTQYQEKHTKPYKRPLCVRNDTRMINGICRIGCINSSFGGDFASCKLAGQRCVT